MLIKCALPSWCKYAGPPYCQAEMYVEMLPPGESWWICWRDKGRQNVTLSALDTASTEHTNYIVFYKQTANCAILTDVVDISDKMKIVFAF